jgi:multidrug efflux system membrane fusion protein
MLLGLILLLYGLPIYLIFFRFKLIPLTTFWKVFFWVPPAVVLVFLWFALGRYMPLAQDAYVQAPVVQVAPEVGGFVAELAVTDNEHVKRGTPLFQIDKRPYQYRVDQANARMVEVQQNTAALLAAVYAAEETVGRADANLVVAQQNVTAARVDLEAARKTAGEVAKQLELAEREATRLAGLVGRNAASRDEYERSLSTVAAQRTQSIDAQNRVVRGEVALEVSTLQVNAAEAAAREARAMRGKAEVMFDPVRTIRRAVQTRQADLDRLKQGQLGPSTPTEDAAHQINEMTAELDRLREYLKTAKAVDPLRQDYLPMVRQAKEALNEAEFALERTTVQAPAEGIVTNFQLTAGTYVRPGVPVASLIDTTRWRLVAPIPENWLENVRPGDEVYFSLRNYPGRVRTGTVEYVGRGVIQGQGVPDGNLPDTDPRRTRQTDTPQAGQEFQVIIQLQDDQPDQPLRVGATGRVTVLAGGGLPVVNELAKILHTYLSWFDYLHPKPSPLVLLIAVALVVGIIVYRRRSARAPAAG